MIDRRITVLLCALFAAACAHSPAGRYNGSWMFAAQALELRADHRFIYRSYSDDGPVICWVRGTWRELPGNRVETTVRDVRFERVKSEPTLPSVAEWQVTRNGIHRPDRAVLKRVREFPARLHWPAD